MADPKPRLSLRIDTLNSALEQKLDNEAAILDLLVSALARGQQNEPLWDQLHAAAQRDDRLAELAFAYERLSRDKKLKSLTPAQQAAVLGHAGAFFADTFGDADGAEGYLERALALAPGDVAAFDKYEQILVARRDLRRLGELYAAAAPHRGDRGEQLRMLRRGAELVEGDAERALKLNQEILRLDPSDARAKKALVSLFEKTGRLVDLAKVLEQQLAQDPPPPEDEALAIRERLLGLYSKNLAEVERALPHVEEILRAKPTHEAARRVAEELLSHKAVTGRAAAALAAAYDAAGEPAEAARMLAIEIEALRGPKRVEAQKKLAALTLTQLGDLEKTFALDEQILPLDPGDDDVRSRFVQLASALDKQLEATRTLTRAASASRDPAVRARIGADMGDLLRELGDAKKARASYQAVLDARADDAASLQAARALAALCREPRDAKGLLFALARLAEVETDEEARVAATAELAGIAEHEVGDLPAAIAAHEKLVGTRAEAESLEALARLYEAAGAWAELATVLDRMTAAARDAKKARELAFRAADIRATKLPDRAAALVAWQAYVATHGASREALARLIPLLEHERRWEELAHALSADAALAPAEEKALLLSRLGQLRLARLGDARGALEAHKQALAIDPAERQSRLAVDRMLSAGELRLAAADVLEPIARAEGSASALVRVLEARAALAEDARSRLAALAEATDLAHRSLRDARRAVELAARGLGEALAASLDDVPMWVERVEVSAGGDAARRASALREALGDRAVDHAVIALLARRAGEALVASGEVADALAVYRRALAFEPSSPELLARVDTLLREQGSPEERLALYRAALDQAAEPERRRDLLHAIGAIQRRDLGDATAALATYRQALAEDPQDRTAFGAVLEIYEAAGAWDDLYAELDRAQQGAVGEERAAIVARLAAIATTRGRLDEAAAHYRELVAGEGAIADEVLAAAEKVASARDDVALQHAVIVRRIAAALDPQEEAAWQERLGEVLRDRMGDAAGAADAWRRAASAAEAAGDSARAARLLERVLDAAPGDRTAAELLLDMYRESEAWDRMPAVYAVLLRAAPDAGEAAKVLLAFEGPALKAGAAERFLSEAESLLRRNDLSDDARRAVRAARARVLAKDAARLEDAAAAYREILTAGDDESGAEARAFDALLRARGAEAIEHRRWLFGFQVERAAEGERAAILIAWAEAEETSLGDPARAAEKYARAVEIDPENVAALAAVARLALARGDHAGAARAIDRRRALAEGAERAALDLELAGLLLDHLDRPVEALAVLTPVLEANPADEAALALVKRALALPPARRAAADLLERAADQAEDVEAFASLLDLLLAATSGDPDLRDARHGWFERLLDREGLPAERALDAALRAAAEIPGDLALWERAEHLARGLSAPDRVAQAYRRALGLAASPPAIAGLDPDMIEEVGRRAVEYHEEWFDEPETVIALLRRVVELHPGSTWAFERLKLVYNLGERWDDLFALYDDAIARTTDVDTRRDLLEDAALAAKDLASDSARAMAYYEALWAIRPEPRIRAALERLFERHGRHRGLVDLLAAELPAHTGEAAQKLRARIAQLWLDGVGDVEQAVIVVEQMLDLEPEREEAFELLERVMQRTAAAPPETREARRRAAARLKDRYHAAGRADDLVRVLEIDLDAAATPAERAERLRQIVRLRLESLHDEAGAFEGTAALLALEPGVAEHRAELARLAEKLGKPARLAEALASAAAAAEGAARVELYAQAADVYLDRLGDTERAIELYKSILAATTGADPAALAAARKLDRLLAAQERSAERAEVLERLAAIEPDRAARRAARQELSITAWQEGDHDRAIRSLRAALADDPEDREAEKSLAGVLEDAGRWDELVALLSARAERGGDEARPDRVRVARLYEGVLDDPARAIEAWSALRAAYGADAESSDALAGLYERTGRFADLTALLEGEATSAEDPARAAELWRHIGDVHRARTGNLDEAVAAYDLALEQRPGDEGARRGLEALLGALDLGAEATKRTLAAAVSSLLRVYGAADDFASAVELLEPRLAAAGSDAERVAILTETATLLERRIGDAGRACDAVLRAFTVAPSEALAARLARLADAADRWEGIAAALAGGLADREDVPRAALRDLFHRVARWQAGRGETAAAEASLTRALAIDPGNVELLEALANVQRGAPGRALVTTLLALAEARGGDLDAHREAVEITEGAAADPALARDLAEKLLARAAADFSREGANAAASWALGALLRLSQHEGPAAMAALYLRGATLPFEAAERRRLRLAAAELLEGDAARSVYEELFAEAPGDALVAERLDAIYRDLGRRDARIAMRVKQIAGATEEALRLALRFDLASLRAEDGDRDGAIAALRENLEAGFHAPSMERLAELYEAGGHDEDLVALCEERAGAAASAGDREGAAALWTKAARLAEDKLRDEARAIAALRRAAALGDTGADEALARLFAARGDHAGAAEVLERIVERAPADQQPSLVLSLVDALRAAGRPAAARARLERAARGDKPIAALRDKLAELYRETHEWGALAQLFAEDADKIADPAARAALLREAADLYLVKRGDAAHAIPLLEKAAALAPEDATVALRLASARRATGDLEQAAAALKAMLAAYGGRRPKERAVVHFELAQVSLAKGDRARALAELDAALKVDPAHPETLQALARLSFEEGQLDRAARTYRALLLVARRPKSAEEGLGPNEVSRAEVLFELSEIARLRGEEDRAAEQLESAFEAARESGPERDRLLGALRARGRHDLLARALEARLAGLSGEDAAAVHEELAAIYEEHLGRISDALEARLAALALSPPSREALSRAKDLAKRAGQVDRFTRALAKLCETERDDARAIDLHVALAQTLEESAHDAHAAEAWIAAEERAKRVDGGAERLAAIWRALAGIYGRLGDEAALTGLLERRIAAAGPGTEPAELADAMYELAALRLARPGAQADAIALLTRAFETDPQPDRAEALLRDALAKGADRSAVGRALEHLARVTGRDRTLVDALVLLAEIDMEHASTATGFAERLEPLKEAVAIAERLGDAALAEDLLQKTIARSVIHGDAPLVWALLAAASHRATAGDLAESANLKERAARASDPERERELLLDVATLSAGPLGDLDRAARLYEELRVREPAEREIWQPLADVYRRKGDRARLASLLEETAPLLEGAAERGRLRLELAKMAAVEDQDKAVTLLKEVIEENPTESEAAEVLAALLEKLGRREELAELVRKQLDAAKDHEDRPAIVELSLRLGALLEQEWDEQGALDVYHAALDWEPKSRELLHQIVRLGMSRDDSLALGDALDALLEVETGDDAVTLALRLADLRGAHGDDESAARALEQGWDAKPGDPRLFEELTKRYTSAGAWRKLAELHIRGAELEKTTSARVAALRRAAELLRDKEGDAPSAADALTRALEVDPKDRDVLIALVDALTVSGEHARAVAAVGQALAVEPEDAWLYRTRASLHEALGDDQAALLDLERAYEKSGGGYADALVDALSRAVTACTAQGTNEARATARGLRLRLAAVLTAAGEIDRARAELTDLTRTDGRDRSAMRALALLEEASGSWDAATAIYRKLLALEDGEALVDTALRLADACERADRLGDARAALERAKRVAPDNAAVRERLRAVYNITGAGRELAALIIEDAANAPDVAGRFAGLMHAGRLLYEAEGEIGSAIAVFEEAKSLKPEDHEATLLLADAYTVAGRMTEARAVLEGAVTAQKGRRAKPLAAVYRRISRIDFAAGDTAGSLAALSRAFDNDPQSAELAMELGGLAVDLDEQDLATRAFRAVTLMKISPDGATTQLRAIAYYHLGRMAYLQGDRRKARLMIDKAVADDPTLEAARALLDQLRSA
jgi:tetratricopeptide (TPR) repeat protein